MYSYHSRELKRVGGRIQINGPGAGVPLVRLPGNGYQAGRLYQLYPHDSAGNKPPTGFINQENVFNIAEKPSKLFIEL